MVLPKMFVLADVIAKLPCVFATPDMQTTVVRLMLLPSGRW